MYRNNSTRFGQIGIEAEKETFINLLKKWNIEEIDMYGGENDRYATPEELEQEFKNAIRDGEIIEL